MTPQERTMLNDFLGKLVSANNISKDAEADAMIRQALVAQPDAGYLLVQNILLMQHTLQEMNARIQSLEASANSNTNTNSSFLGSQNQNAVKSYFGNSGQNTQQHYQQPQAQPQMQQQQQGSGFGDFLKSAGTTAAGVAGGMFLFEGISSMFGSHQSSGFGGGYSGGGATTVNNYYSEPAADTNSNDFLGSNDIDSSFASDSSSFDMGDDPF